MTKETYDLVAEQLLDATDEDVFDAYTDADAGRTGFAGGPDWDVDVACDLRVGGVWSIRKCTTGWGGVSRDEPVHLGRSPPPLGFRVGVDDAGWRHRPSRRRRHIQE